MSEHLDPFSEIVLLLKPSMAYAKIAEFYGQWRVVRESDGEADGFFAVLHHGECIFKIDDHPPTHLRAGDFILIPAMSRVENISVLAPPDGVMSQHYRARPGYFQIGTDLERALREDALDTLREPDTRMHVGQCHFASPDRQLLLSLLPSHIVIHDKPRLVALAAMVDEESKDTKPARTVLMEKLLEILLIEALRSRAEIDDTPGLMRGLADKKLRKALAELHQRPEYAWTVERLAEVSTLSRSAFFSRFRKIVGMAPMEYLSVWRMALAKHLLAEKKFTMEQIANRIGYSSASAFSVAFTRQTGMPPSAF